MTNGKWCFSAVLVLAGFVGGVSANAASFDADRPMTTTVPFRFVVGTTVLPAGQYEIRTSTADPTIIWLVSPNGQHVAVTNTIWGGDPFEGSHPDLAFEVHGKVRFLERIDVPGEPERLVAVTPQEVEQGLAPRPAGVRSGTWQRLSDPVTASPRARRQEAWCRR